MKRLGHAFQLLTIRFQDAQDKLSGASDIDQREANLKALGHDAQEAGRLQGLIIRAAQRHADIARDLKRIREERDALRAQLEQRRAG